MKLALLALVLALPALQEPTREERVAALQRAFDELADAGLSGAAVVAAGDEVLLERACGLADRTNARVNQTDTQFDIGSITKQFTATAILQLEQAGKLSTRDSLQRFFRETPADKRSIQLHHLLTHTSGLPKDVPVDSRTVERDALVRTALAAKLQSKPGEQFVYNNVGYMLLGAVVEIAAGQSFEDYLAQHLFAPAGLTSSTFLGAKGIDPLRVASGYEGSTKYGPADQGWYSWGLRGAGGVLSTTGDLLRWSRALQTDAVLSKAQREKLFTPYSMDYAYGLWVVKDGTLGRLIHHEGTTRGFEGALYHAVDHDLRVIVLCNDRGRCEAAARKLALVASGAKESKASVSLSQKDLAAFAGEYEALRGGLLTVRVDGDALVVQPDAAAVAALEARGGSTKLAADPAAKKRVEKLIACFAAGDSVAAKPLLSDRYTGWNEQMVEVWRGWIDSRGKLERSECLGSLGHSLTLVRLVHERRSVVWTLAWKDEVLSAWTIDGGLPENAHYRAVSESEFEYAEDREQARTYTLVFERAKNGAVRGLALKGVLLDVHAQRKSK